MSSQVQEVLSELHIYEFSRFIKPIDDLEAGIALANGFNIWNQTLAKWLPKLKETSFKEDSEVKQVFWRVVQSSLAKSQLLQKVIKYKFNQRRRDVSLISKCLVFDCAI